MKQDIVENLRAHASIILRIIPRAKPGERDRIADLCEEAADEIEELRARIREYERTHTPLSRGEIDLL